VRPLSVPTIAALSARSVPVVQLLLLNFGWTKDGPPISAGAIALNSSTWDLVWAGVTYKGAYGLGTINVNDDSPGEGKDLQFEMSGVAADAIALALDGADQWQGTPIVLRTAVLDANYQIVDAPIEWTGTGDTMALQEDGDRSTIQATAESSAVDLLRGTPLTYSDADQQSLHPGDLAFQYVASQTGQPVVWPSKEFFYK